MDQQLVVESTTLLEREHELERVRVDAECLRVTRQGVDGAPAHWIVGPTWARVENGPNGVGIAAGGRIVHVGSFLSPPERGDFATALRNALARAKA